MLEFFRRASSPEDVAQGPALEPTPRMLVLRRSQAIVAGAAAVAALVLFFLLGMAVGSAGGGETVGAAPDVYVLLAAHYGDDEKGRGLAKAVKDQLDRLNLGEEVAVVRDAAGNRMVVAVGAWLEDPGSRKEAIALRDRLRSIKDERTREAPFAGADFWRMKR